MAVHYGVLKGHIVRTGRTEDVQGSKNHFHIIVSTGDHKAWRCPVNILSADRSEVWFKIEQPLGDFPVLQRLKELAVGLTKLPRHEPGLALDYVRQPMFDRALMQHLPYRGSGQEDDIQDYLKVHTDRAMRDSATVAYVFGSWWENQAFPADHFFGTDRGVHDVHMNQGNAQRFAGDDGIYQDGGILLWHPQTGWVGIFLAFNSQVWFTDDQGHRLPNFAEGPLVGTGTHPIPVRPDTVEPPPVVPGPGAAPLCLIAALVNPAKDDAGRETVTLFNAGLEDVDLGGWTLVDGRGRPEILEPQILAGNTAVTLRLTGKGAQLSNKGDTIRLVSPGGVQMDSVTYSATQASVENRIVRF